MSYSAEYNPHASDSDSDLPMPLPGGGFGMGDMMMLPVTESDIRRDGDTRDATIPDVFPSHDRSSNEFSGVGEYMDDEDAKEDPPASRSIALTHKNSDSRSDSRHRARGHHHDRDHSSFDAPYVPPSFDICFLTSSPLVFGDAQVKPFPQLNVHEGRTDFVQIVRQAHKSLRLMHLTAHSRNLIEAVTAGCKVLHYVGHVIKDYLAFEDRIDIGKQHLLHWDKVKQILTRDPDQRLSLVFAVGSGSQDAAKCFAQAGVAHVVGVSAKFDTADFDTREFTKHFYYALVSGQSIQRCFSTASGAVEAMSMSSGSRLDERKFILLPEDGDHNVSIFADLQAGDVETILSEDCPNNLPPPIQPFVGREIDMRNVARVLLSQQGRVRLVVLESRKGLGKSATAQMVGKYCCDRGIFAGGVYLINPSRQSRTGTQYENLEGTFRLAITEASAHDGEDFDVVTWLRRRQKKMLFIFDECNDVPRMQIHQLLQKVFDYTSSDTKVLLTWEESLRVNIPDFPNVIMRYWTLEPISEQDAAKLLAQCMNYAWTESHISRNRKIMEIIVQSPAHIRDLATTMEQRRAESLDELAELYTTNLLIMNQFRRRGRRRQVEPEVLEENMSDRGARRMWETITHNTSLEAKYEDVFEQLNHEYMAVCTQRPLRPEDLREKFVRLGMDESDVVHAEHFDRIYGWFRGVCAIVRALDDKWSRTQPVLVEGFVGRGVADRILSACNPGTFLVRFASQENGLAISYAGHGRVTHMLMSLKPGTDHWDIKAYSGDRLEHTFAQFIHLYTPLTHIYHRGSAPLAKELYF